MADENDLNSCSTQFNSLISHYERLSIDLCGWLSGLRATIKYDYARVKAFSNHGDVEIFRNFFLHKRFKPCNVSGWLGITCQYTLLVGDRAREAANLNLLIFNAF